MAFDDVNEDRRRLLDEIRKRAEEAELARIEADEIRLGEQLSDIMSATPLPPPPRRRVSSPEKNRELHEQFIAAVRADDLGLATTAFDALAALDPLDEKIAEFKSELYALKERATGESRHNTVNLMKAARELYQAEKYEEALATLSELFALDPDNSDASALRIDVGKAKELAGRLLEEELRRRREEAEERNFVVQPLKIIENPIDVPGLSEQSDDMQLNELPADPAVRSEPAESSVPPKANARRRLQWFALAIVGLLGLAAAYVVFKMIHEKFFAPKATLLVLPARSSNVEEYFVDGLTEDLISHLSHVQTLQVCAPNTSLRFHLVDGRKAAQSVGAEYFLTWNIVKTTAGFNVQILLSDTGTSRHLVDRSFDVSPASVGDFCHDIVPGLVDAMGLDAKGFQSPYAKAANGEAYDAYLHGVFFMSHPGFVSLDSMASVFGMSCKSDPAFPYAEAALGWTNILRHEASPETTRTYLDEALRNLQRAMILGAKNSETYKLWGAIEYHHSSFKDAIERLGQAVNLAPSDADAQRRLSLAYVRAGRNEDAVTAAKIAVARDPMNSTTRRFLATVLMLRGEYASGIKEFEADVQNLHLDTSSCDEYLAALVAVNRHERALGILKARTQMNSRDFVTLYELGRMLQLAGQSKSDWNAAFQEALNLIDDTLATHPRFALAHSYRGLVQTRLGLFAEGIASNKRALDLSPVDIDVLYNTARMFALQQNPEALRYLNLGVNRRFKLKYVLDLDFASIRNEPGFTAIIN